MIEKPLGIYYLDYAERFVQASLRKMVIGTTRSGLLEDMDKRGIQPEWFCWLAECRTPGFLVVGATPKVKAWIELHMPDKFGEPLRNIPDY
jgi:hypothetical protein